MRNIRFIGFSTLLLAGVGAAVTTVLAQSPVPEPGRDRQPRIAILDGRGGQLGVTVRDLDAAGLKAAGGAQSGVRISDVDADGPAAKAGIREGDIVVEVDGDRVRSARQFARLIAETPDGRSVRLGIVRDNQRQTVDVTPQARTFAWSFDGDRIGREVERSLRDLEPRLRDLEPRLRELEPRLREFRWDGPAFRFDPPIPRFDWDVLPRLTNPRSRLGVQLEPLTPQLGEFFGATDGGVLIASVSADSVAAKAGLRAGDVITAINGDRVRDYDDVVNELRDLDGEITIAIVRDKKGQTLKVTLEPARSRAGRPV
jgi:serine protease Do